MDRAVAAARQAFDKGSWSTTPPAERGKVLMKMADLLEKRVPEIAKAWCAQIGGLTTRSEGMQMGSVMGLRGIAALGRRGGRPWAVVERLARGGDRAVHVGIAGGGDAGDHVLAVGVHDLDALAREGRDPFAADEQLVGMPDGYAFGGHGVSPKINRRHCEGPKVPRQSRGGTEPLWIASLRSQ
jgi:hypothetical protein